MSAFTSAVPVGKTMPDWTGTTRIPLHFAVEHYDIRVSRSDINRGTPADERLCAFALAAQHIPGCLGAVVMASTIHVYFADKVIQFGLDGRSIRAVRAFDANNGFASEAGTFSLLPVAASKYPAVKAASNRHHRAIAAQPGYVANQAARGTRAILTRMGVRNGTGTVRSTNP